MAIALGSWLFGISVTPTLLILLSLLPFLSHIAYIVWPFFIEIDLVPVVALGFVFQPINLYLVTIPITDYTNKTVITCYAVNNTNKISIFEKQHTLLGYNTASTGMVLYPVGGKVGGVSNYSLKLYAIL